MIWWQIIKYFSCRHLQDFSAEPREFVPIKKAFAVQFYGNLITLIMSNPKCPFNSLIRCRIFTLIFSTLHNTILFNSATSLLVIFAQTLPSSSSRSSVSWNDSTAFPLHLSTPGTAYESTLIGSFLCLLYFLPRNLLNNNVVSLHFS